MCRAPRFAPGWDLMPRHLIQPRDGRGRFLSQAWLRTAESFTASDLQWFRSRVPEGQ